MSNLAYKPNCGEVLERLRSLYAREAGDRILATMAVPSAALDAFKAAHPHAECEYPDPDERADFWDQLLRGAVAIEDDSLPGAYLSEFDQGLYGGLLGGEVRFMAHPGRRLDFFDGPAAAEGLGGVRPAPLRRVASLVAAVPAADWRSSSQRSRGKWGISHFILIDALNFVFELIGATRNVSEPR